MTASRSATASARPPPNHQRTPHDAVRLRRWIGLGLGVLLASACYVWVLQAEPSDPELAARLRDVGCGVAAVATLMAILWVTEAIPLPITALLPVALLPLLTGGRLSVAQVTAPYAQDVIFLFLGAFLLAQAVQAWGLHRRFALHTLLWVGSSPRRLAGGFMLASAFLSLWVSNTATTVMMLPIAMSVTQVCRDRMQRVEGAPGADSDAAARFSTCLLLCTAYGASIGGIGTLVGTPPNALLAGFMRREYNVDLSFVKWLGVGLPLVGVFLPVAWFVLTHLMFRLPRRTVLAQRDFFRAELAKMGPVSTAERMVLVVFALAAATWIFRPLIVEIRWFGGSHPLAGLSDAGIAIGAATILFLLPTRSAGRWVSLLTWKEAATLPWGVLMLFGGGLSLASAIESGGVASLIAGGVGALRGCPPWILVLLVTAVVVFLTELTSNTATTATFLPILGAAAVGLNMHPLLMTMPAAIGASCAFMLPVATPPNAIVFGSGEVTIGQMCRAGLWLNLIAITLIMMLMYGVVVPSFGLA